MNPIDILSGFRDELRELDIFSESTMPQTWEQVRFGDVVTPQYIANLIKFGGAMDPGRPHPASSGNNKLKFPFYYEDSMGEFHNDAGTYPAPYKHLKKLPYEDMEKHPDYPDALLAISRQHFQFARKKFQKQIKTQRGGIVASRAISVSEPTVQEIRAGGTLGIYWTFDPDSYSGQGFWSDDADNHVFLIGLVPPSSVDWIQTYVRNMDWFVGMSECELRLISGQPVVLKQIEAGGEKLSVSRNGKWTA